MDFIPDKKKHSHNKVSPLSTVDHSISILVDQEEQSEKYEKINEAESHLKPERE